MTVKSIKKEYDIIIVGAGMVGLVFAAAIVDSDLRIAIIDSQQPKLRWSEQDLSARVSAINRASQRILSNIDVWADLRESTYCDLQRLKVWDSIAGGKIEFDAADIGLSSLGAIVENREIVRALWQKLQTMQNIELYAPAKPLCIDRRDDSATLHLENKATLVAKLIVGADGANSWVRDQFESHLQRRPYQQQAIVAISHCEKPHENTGWQSFLPTGPIGVLPLRDPNQVAIVWSADTDYADSILKMKPIALSCELTNSLDACLGQMELLNEPKAIPLSMRHVKNYVDSRIVLIGDAAHTIHPLAGQGANLGFLDAACLAQCLTEACERGYDIGSLRPLRRYERWRKGDNALMLLAMRSFKEIFSSQASLVMQLRSQGFNMTDRLSLIKNCIMRFAVGNVKDVPQLARIQ